MEIQQSVLDNESIARDCKPKLSAVGHGAQQRNRVDEWVVKWYFFKALKQKFWKPKSPFFKICLNTHNNPFVKMQENNKHVFLSKWESGVQQKEQRCEVM